MNKKIKLILEDKSEFAGYSFGADVFVNGEVVFNTGMVGYPETLTDPSYKGQILVLTYPLVGNYGIPKEISENKIIKNFESEKIQINGLVVSEYCENYSHFAAKKSLSNWLKENNIPAIYGVDTRELTKKLRIKGSMRGAIVESENKKADLGKNNKVIDEVSIKQPIIYNNGKRKKVVLVDCGLKLGILRSLVERNVEVIRVPWDYDFRDLNYDGILLSNGPGNPKDCDKLIKNIRQTLAKNKPIFGICLGNQIMALAAGADTYKLKFGHRSQNQPCLEVGGKQCYITSQNHGYAVLTKTLPTDWKEWFVNANDGTNEGIKHKSKPFYSVQFHPEALPGPTDTNFLFDDFVKNL